MKERTDGWDEGESKASQAKIKGASDTKIHRKMIVFFTGVRNWEKNGEYGGRGTTVISRADQYDRQVFPALSLD